MELHMKKGIFLGFGLLELILILLGIIFLLIMFVVYPDFIGMLSEYVLGFMSGFSGPSYIG